MDIFEQLMQVPYAYTWLPVLGLLTIAGGCCWMMRPGTRATAGNAEPESVDDHSSLQKKESQKNQRVATRRQGNPIEVFVASPECKETPATGSVLDRSLGGLRLALFQEVEVGTVLAVRPMVGGNIVPWIDIKVRSCKVSSEMPGQFEIGCEYVKSPPYSIQLLFG